MIEPMKSGDFTQVVRTTRGYQIFKIESITASREDAVRAGREQISDRVFTGKRKEEFDKYLAKLRDTGDYRLEESLM